MKLQNNVLNCYKEKFPNHTLKMISQRTGIQLTRVFRLFNGHEMKLSEYEAFQTACFRQKDDSLFSKFFELSIQSVQSLKEDELRSITHHMEDLIEVSNIKKGSLIEEYSQILG
jgi:hypothetical protein